MLYYLCIYSLRGCSAPSPVERAPASLKERWTLRISGSEYGILTGDSTKVIQGGRPINSQCDIAPIRQQEDDNGPRWK